jgi:hypothetical protein
LSNWRTIITRAICSLGIRQPSSPIFLILLSSVKEPTSILHEKAALIAFSFIQAQNIKKPPKITPLSMISILKDFLKADEITLRFDLFALNQVTIFILLIICNLPCVMTLFWTPKPTLETFHIIMA